MQETITTGKIVSGYRAWMQENKRAASNVLEFGAWWRLDTTYWRVAWIETTSELYAAEQKPSDRYIVLTWLDKKEVNELMKKWFDGNNLSALLHRFAPEPPAQAALPT